MTEWAQIVVIVTALLVPQAKQRKHWKQTKDIS